MLLRLLDTIRSKLRLTPGYGTEGFEAREEVLDDRARALEVADLSKADAATIDRELSAATEQLEEHLRTIDSYEPGRGFIAAEATRRTSWSGEETSRSVSATRATSGRSPSR